MQSYGGVGGASISAEQYRVECPLCGYVSTSISGGYAAKSGVVAHIRGKIDEIHGPGDSVPKAFDKTELTVKTRELSIQ